MTPTRPELSRNAISFSPSSISRIGVAVGLQLRRHRRRNPVLPHQLAHDRARPDPDEILAVLPVHRDSSRQFGFRTNPKPFNSLIADFQASIVKAISSSVWASEM